MKFIFSYNRVPFVQATLFGGSFAVHRYLVEVGEEFVLLHVYSRVVTHGDASLVVSKYLILLYLGERTTWAQDAWPLVLMDLIIAYLHAAIEHHNTISVVVDIVVFDPTEACFYSEDAFTPWLINEVVEYHCVCWVGSSVCDVGLIVRMDLILLNVSTRTVYQQYALPIITKYAVVDQDNRGISWDFDPRFSVAANMMIFVYSSEVLVAFEVDAILMVLFNPVVFYYCIWP
jgi:hypothetical protein